MSDGTEVTVKVTLTGNIRYLLIQREEVIPNVQKVEGGKQAVKPKELQKKGYTFEGWFYTDENGNETVWDFAHRYIRI